MNPKHWKNEYLHHFDEYLEKDASSLLTLNTILESKSATTMKKSTASVRPKTIDVYLEALPAKVRGTLEKIRKTIRSVAPKAEEVISYQIPVFKYYGMLVGFAAFKNHCSFFMMSRAMMATFTEELKSYDTAPGTIRFTLDKPLPSGLIKKLVIARIKENEAKMLAKKSKRAIKAGIK